MKTWLYRAACGFLILLLSALVLSFIFIDQLGLEQNVNEILQSSSPAHWFGTDTLGRDLFRRVLQGGQVSVSIALLTTVLAFVFGVIYGSVAGWYEGFLDTLLMRFLDVISSIPGFVMVSLWCLLIQHFLTFDDVHLKSFISLSLAISLTHWMGLARVTRGLVMETKRMPFIEASRTLGAKPFRILAFHVFPNMRNRLLVLAVLQIPTNIMYESYMSFIGLGIQPPWTSWGLLVQEGWKTLSAFPHLILFPSLVLFLTIWSFNIVLDHWTNDGDGGRVRLR